MAEEVEDVVDTEIEATEGFDEIDNNFDEIETEKVPVVVIAPEELSFIAAAKSQALLAVAQAEKAAADARVADLEYRSAVQQVFIKYGLRASDRIDEKTGEIVKQEGNK